ncbi:MAG TPA: hypothetical protein VIR00_14505, partial [Micromonosporaceae bacterium]
AYRGAAPTVSAARPAATVRQAGGAVTQSDAETSGEQLPDGLDRYAVHELSGECGCRHAHPDLVGHL